MRSEVSDQSLVPAEVQPGDTARWAEFYRGRLNGVPRTAKRVAIASMVFPAMLFAAGCVDIAGPSADPCDDIQNNPGTTTCGVNP